MKFHPADVRLSQYKLGVLELNKKVKEKSISYKTISLSSIEKTNILETIFLGIAHNPLYFNGKNNNNWITIIGNSYLNTIIDFMDNKFLLTNTKYYSFIEGKYYKDLNNLMRSRFVTTYLNVYLILSANSNDIVKELESRIENDRKLI